MMNLYRHWRKGRREEKRLRRRKKTGAQVLRMNILANAGETQRQQLL